MRSSRLWRLWCKALGEKYGRNDREADTIACIRTLIFVSYLVTNTFIISGVIRHWNGTKGLAQINQRDQKEYLRRGSDREVSCLHREQMSVGIY